MSLPENGLPKELEAMAKSFSPESEKQFEIGRIQHEDVDALLDIQEQGWIDTYQSEAFDIHEADIREHFVQDRPRLRERWVNAVEKPTEDQATFVARDEKGPVGFIFLSKRENETRIPLIYVKKEYWGKSVAQDLMNQGLAWAPQEKPVVLWVAETNTRARRFYERNGFEVTGSGGGMHITETKSLPNLRMERSAREGR